MHDRPVTTSKSRRRLAVGMLWSILAVLAVGGSFAPGSTAGTRDDPDGDGVRGTADACPATPARAALFAHGCSAVELVRRPEIVLGSLSTQVDEALALLADARPLDAAREKLEHGRSQMLNAMDDLAQGDACKADRKLADAAAELRRGAAAMDRGVEDLAVGLLAGRSARGEDVEEAAVTVAFLRMLGGKVGHVVDAAMPPLQTTGALCRAVAGKLNERALVVQTHDAAGLIELDNGRTLALASKASTKDEPVYEGLAAHLKGVLFSDGTGVVVDAKAATKEAFQGTIQQGPCMELRIAPIQPFWPYSDGPYVLHDPSAYADASGVLQLETRMRLAAVELPCPHTTPQGLTLRYGMNITAYDPGSKVLAFDLEDGDDPVFLQANQGAVTLKASVYVESCKILANGMNQCSVPKAQYVTFYDTQLRPTGFYSTAVYSQTTFGVKDNKIDGDFDTAAVVAMDLEAVPPGTNVSFTARGYKVTGDTSSKPQLVDVDQGESFAVYDADAFYPDDDVLFKFDAAGVDRASGLLWPRIVGTRNGHEFWYSSRVPSLVRDRVAQCPGDPDTYHRLPFYGGWPEWVVNTGNYGDPVHGHGAGQPFAWDFNAPPGTDIAASRGGRVVWVVEDEYLNAKDYPKDPNDPTKVAPGWTDVGNFLWILHDDGSVAVYFHLIQWGAEVEEGDIVHRGDHIANVGNTGASSTDHLHFEGDLETVDWHKPADEIDVDKHPSNFEALVGKWAGPYFMGYEEEDCYVPLSGDRVVSTQ